MGHTRIRQKRNELLISSPLVKSSPQRCGGDFFALPKHPKEADSGRFWKYKIMEWKEIAKSSSGYTLMNSAALGGNFQNR